ncbi:MAG: hypothetical protein WBQ94_18050 [Terracidiphilus sp.]
MRVQKSGIRAFLGGLSGRQSDFGSLHAGLSGVFGLRFHDVGLFFDRSQGFVYEPAGYPPNNHKKPVWDVCRGQQFTPWILGRFFGGLFLIVCAMLAIDYDNWFGRIGGFLFVLGIVVLAAPVPWDLGPCPANQTEGQHSEYRQMFQHGENVSQIPVLAMVSNETIADMKAIKDWFKHGMTHLTLSFVFAVFGIDAAVSFAAAWITRQAQVSLGLSALPTHFYVLLGVLVFCAVTLFAIFIAILHKSVVVTPNAKPQFPIPSPPSKLVIHSAFYGNSPENEKPVIDTIKSMPTEALAFEVGFSALHIDPAENIPPKKTLRVVYSYENEAKWETSAIEGEWIFLPAPPERKKRIS